MTLKLPYGRYQLTTLDTENSVQSDDENFRRELIVRAAYEKRHDDPTRDYGVGGIDHVHVLIGPNGAVGWQLLTTMFLPHVNERFKDERWMRPTPGPLSFHAKDDRYGDVRDCEFVGKCSSEIRWDGEGVYEAYASGGYEAMFAKLREFYEAYLG